MTHSQMNIKKAIISRLFGFDQRTMDFLFDPHLFPRLRARPEIILYDSWEFSQEKQLLVRAALDIWNGSGHVFLWELLSSLSPQNFSQIIAALIECRELEQSTLKQMELKNG